MVMAGGDFLVRRAWLTVGDSGEGIVQWPPAAASRAGSAPGSRARLAVRGEVLVADATASGPESLEVADVIYRRGGPSGGEPLSWLTRYPGCAVAVSRSEGGGCLAAARAGRPLLCSFFIKTFMHNERWLDLPVCGMFVHGWSAAGWPLDALDPSRLTATGNLSAAARALNGSPIPFGMYYEGPA
jgi:hypothetical protein